MNSNSTGSTSQSITYQGGGGGSGAYNAVYGWECPRCHRILSPFTDECPCYLNRGLTNSPRSLQDLLATKVCDAPDGYSTKTVLA